MRTVKISGLGERSREQVQFELDQGARFIVFEYVISVLFIPFLLSSPVFYVPPGEESRPRGFRWVLYRWIYAVLSAVFGFWGFPTGTILCVLTIRHNFSGGRDVTHWTADLLGFDAGEPPQKPWVHRVLFAEFGPRTDVRFMTRQELLRSGLIYTAAGILFNAVFFVLVAWILPPGPDFGKEPAYLYVAYMIFLLGLMGLVGGLYLLVRGLLRPGHYARPDNVVYVDVVVVD